MKKTLFVLPITLSLLLTGCGEEESIAETEVSNTVEIEDDISLKTEEATSQTDDWLLEVQDIAESDGSDTQKFDQVMMIVKDFSFSNEEIKVFESDLIEEFETGNYLADIEDAEYMLINAFKSRAIDINYDDSLLEAIDSFAFDFHQNTKYTFRKVDAVDSDAVNLN